MSCRSGRYFILGLHRSGTTLLYELLQESGLFNVVTARHVVMFDALAAESRLAESADSFSVLRKSHRGIDPVSVGPDTPEEYGFILERTTGTPSFTRGKQAALCDICERVQATWPENRPLLLKNPWDFGQSEAIRACYPHAQFVFIHRDPVVVLSSTFRMVREWMQQRSEYLALLSRRYDRLTTSGFAWRAVRLASNSAPGLLARWVIGDVGRRVRSFMRNYQVGNARGGVHLRYESLCADPDAAIRRVLSDWGFDRKVSGLSDRIQPSTTIADPFITQRAELVRHHFGEYASAFGYDLSHLGGTRAGTATNAGDNGNGRGDSR